MVLTCCSLPLATIRLDPAWNLHPWALATLPPGLRDSLTSAGILHPPLVLPRPEGDYQIIAGQRRLHFARQEGGGGEVACLCLDPAISPSQLLAIVLADQAATGGLSPAEKARFVTIATPILGDAAVIRDFLPLLGMARRPETLRSAERIAALDPRLLTALDTGFVSEKIGLELLRLSADEDRLALLQLFEELAMGEGKQRRFLTLSRDIAARRGQGVAAFLRDREVQAIREHPVLNHAQKIQHLGDLLQRLVTPALSQAEEEFKSWAKSLPLPANGSLGHTPSFEKDEVTLTITFRNRGECAAYLKGGYSSP